MSTSAVFIPHEIHVWVSGEIIKDVDAQGQVEIKYNDESLPNEHGTKVVSLKKFGLPSLPQQNIDIPLHGVEDMTKLNYLHEPSILDNLRR
jgi:myosin heavy subunit